MIYFLTDKFPADLGLLIDSTTRPYECGTYEVRRADTLGPVARFTTAGVNGKTNDETAIGNAADLSDYVGKVKVYRVHAFSPRRLLATCEFGCVTPAAAS
jgi:hypothetical protein